MMEIGFGRAGPPRPVGHFHEQFYIWKFDEAVGIGGWICRGRVPTRNGVGEIRRDPLIRMILAPVAWSGVAPSKRHGSSA